MGLIEIIGALAIWVRDFLHFGPHGKYLWLILIVINVPVGVLLYWDKLRGAIPFRKSHFR
ncbi:MAG: hypothetical protein M3077_01955 [Candidatus Dormibacteraeota bacterium]|nr:hypothetical protein [Candidatus Dormibacteraeota bacterium]